MDTDIRTLCVEDVIAVHADQLERYGGSAGVREISLLESAVHAVIASFGGTYLHGTIHEMAGAYLYYIVKNHPFIDGNKRAGAAAALVFLDQNGYELGCDDDALADAVLAVASGTMTKDQIIDFIRKQMRPL